MSDKTKKAAALAAAKNAAISMRIVLNDARSRLEEFETYVDDWDEQLAASGEDDVTHDPRQMTELYVTTRALEMLGEIEHMPTGGTQHMHLRAARSHLYLLSLAGKR